VTSLLRLLLKCLLNLSIRGQTLLPVVDVFGAGWVGKCRFHCTATLLLLKMAEDPTAAEHREAHRKQDQRHRTSSTQGQGTRHHLSANTLQYGRQASDSQLLTSWINPKQEARLCHICLRAAGMDTGRSASEKSETEWLCVYTSQDIRLLKFTNRHPSDSRQPHPYVPTPSLYAGDFNCQHVNWGFNTTFPDGESLVSWEAANNLELLHIRSTMKQEQPLQRMKLRPDRR